MKRKGVSLIVLIITIVVIIILSVAVILSLTNTNVIKTAEEAKVKADINTITKEIELKVIDEKLKGNEGKLTGELSEFVSEELASKYGYMFNVLDGELMLKDEHEETSEQSPEYYHIQWAKQLGIKTIVIPKEEDTYEFDEIYSYTGEMQQVTIEHSGVYTLQVWGAEGGANTGAGGKGGYSVGTVKLSAGTTLYIYVGSKGGNSGSYGTGGWNGRRFVYLCSRMEWRK